MKILRKICARQHLFSTISVCLLTMLVVSFYLSPFLVAHTEVAAGSWTSKTPMNEARGGLGVAVVNGKIYAIGGSTESGHYGGVGQISTGPFVTTNEEYDPATDTWTFKTPMPTPRASFGIAVYQNKIYCIGGRTNSSNTGVNEVYNPATDTWETKATMPTPRAHLCANVVNGKIYLIGGIPNSSVNEVYDPSNNSWNTLAPIANDYWSYASAVADNKIYVIGGSWDNFQYRGNQIYDPKTDSWSSGAPAPEGAIFGAAGVTTGAMAPKRIYVFGVTFPIGLSAPPFVTQAYNLENNSWTICASIPTARINLGVAVANDMFYAVGGDTYSGLGLFSPSAANEQYTLDTTSPTISIVSPENKTYTVKGVPLTFTVSEPASWIRYSLDGQANVTIAGNTTLTGLSDDPHSLVVYAKDVAGNTGASQTTYFSKVTPPPDLNGEIFLITNWIFWGMIIITVIGAALLVYFRKIRKTTGKAEIISEGAK